MKKPKNYGKCWTIPEIEELNKSPDHSSKTILELSKKLGRTPVAVANRLRQLTKQKGLVIQRNLSGFTKCFCGNPATYKIVARASNDKRGVIVVLCCSKRQCRAEARKKALAKI